MKSIIIYETKVCHRCKILAKYLKGLGYDFDRLDLESPEGRTEARCAGFFGVEAPGLQIIDKIYSTRDLFDKADRLMEDKVLKYLEKAYEKHEL